MARSNVIHRYGTYDVIVYAVQWSLSNEEPISVKPHVTCNSPADATHLAKLLNDAEKKADGTL